MKNLDMYCLRGICVLVFVFSSFWAGMVSAEGEITITLTSSANPVHSGSPVTYTAVVKSADPGSTIPITGNVEFSVNVKEQYQSVPLDANGVATFTLSAGVFNYGDEPAEVLADYSMIGTGTADRHGSAALMQAVTGALSTTTITSVINTTTGLPVTSIDLGEEITVNFSVGSIGANSVNGIVSVSDGATTCLGSPSTGFCKLMLTIVGNRTLVASFASVAPEISGSSSAGVVINVGALIPELSADVFTVVEDSVTELDVLANDLDPLSLTITELSVPDKGGVVTVLEGTKISYTPAANFNGIESFAYEAMSESGGKAMAAVSVTVTAENDLPVIVNIPTATASVGLLYSSEITATDAEEEAITYSASELPAWLTLNNSTGLLTGTPAQVDVGIVPITLAVSDGVGSVLHNFSLEVLSVNQPPVITSTPPLSGSTGQLYTYTVSATDANEDTLTFSAGALPAWLTFDATTKQLSGTPGVADVGAVAVMLKVTDGVEEVQQSFTLDVVSGNQAPVISSSPIASVNVSDQYTYTISATDPDGDTLTFSAVDLPSWLTFDASLKRLSGVPSVADAGSESTITLIVSDGHVDTTQSFLLSVKLGNDKPVITSSPVERATVDGNYLYRLTATDADENPLTFSASVLPAWLTFNVETAELSGTPGAGDVGQTEVILQVSDGTETVKQSFLISVNNQLFTDASVLLTSSANPVRLGQSMQVIANVTNEGSVSTSLTTVTMTFIGNAVITAPDGCAEAAAGDVSAQFVCSVDSLAPAASTGLSFTVDAAAAGDIKVGASLSLAEDTLSDNNLDDIELTATADIMNTVEQEIGMGGAAVLAGDINNDGLTDLVMLGGVASGVEIYLNQAGSWVLTQSIGGADVAVVGGVLADLSGDAIPDLVVVRTQGQSNKAYLNDGTGHFTQRAALGSADSYDVAAADLNADGWKDLVFANNGPNTVYMNNAGAFTLTDLLGNADSRGVAIGDLDGDGRPDIVFANTDTPSEIFNNTALLGVALNGQVPDIIDDDVIRQVARSGYGAKVAATGALPGTVNSSDYDVAILDANNDGFNDLIFASGIKKQLTLTDSLGNPLFQNDGTGTFTETKRLGNADTRSLAVVDVDNDGNTDVISFNQNGVHQLYRNFDSQFAVHGAVFDLPGTTGGAVANLDDDGLADIIFVSTENGNPLLLNRLDEQLDAGDDKWFGDLQVNIGVGLGGLNAMAVGDTQAVAVTITNHGAREAANVILESVIDAGLTVETVEASKGTCEVVAATNLARCTIASLATGEQVTIQVRVKATSAGEKKVVATTKASRSDSSPADNQGSQLVSVTSATTGGDTGGGGGGGGGGGSVALWMLLLLSVGGLLPLYRQTKKSRAA